MSPSATLRKPVSRKGVCRAIFAVTGVVDEVQDLILPGAFTRTLAERPVKTVFHHEWKDPVGVVLEVAEWKPGDPRFAEIPGWPVGAGALVATLQFNLRTTRGRDVYEQVRQWHEYGQAQFSIGYKVPTGKASKRFDGVRIIHELDLYEVSPVLHGAHPMTRSLEVKSVPTLGEVERKAVWSQIGLEGKSGAEPEIGRGVMVALYPPRDVAEKLAHPDGTPAAELHVTLAYLGDADQLPGHPDDLADLVRQTVEEAGPLEGTVGGIGRFPDHGNGAPTWVPVDVPGLSALREQIAGAISRSPLGGALRTDHGFTPHMTLGYDLPDDVPAAPSVPVGFDTVHVVRGVDRTPIRLAGPRVDGMDTDAPDGVDVPLEPQRQGLELKTARQIVAEARALRVETKSARQIVAEAKSHPLPEPAPEGPVYQPLSESFEQIRASISDAARELLVKKGGDCMVSVEATYPDYAIVTVHHMANEESESYSVPYRVVGDDVSLGTPQPVELTTVVLPDRGEQREASMAESVDARVVQPSMDALVDTTARVTASDATGSELEELRPSVEELLAALSRKGLDMGKRPEPAAARQAPIDLWDDDEPSGYDAEDYDDSDDPGGDPDTGLDELDDLDDLPAAAPRADEQQESDQVRLDVDEVKAQLAAIRPTVSAGQA